MDGDAPTDDTVLLAAARRGDRRAFGELYRRHSPAVHGLALRVLGDRAAAEDVVQDVFLRALDHLDDLRDAGRLAAWLKRSAANASIDLIRRRRPLADPHLLDAVEAESTGPEALDAAALLDRLSGPARGLVWLFTVEGWTHPELAHRFGRTESWSKSIISRAFAKLREAPAMQRENDHGSP